jgi:hypothetical protein
MHAGTQQVIIRRVLPRKPMLDHVNKRYSHQLPLLNRIPVVSSNIPQSRTGYTTSLPGFNTPFGSNCALTARITAIPSGS